MPEFVIGLGLLILFGTTVFPVLPTVALIPSGGSAFTHPRELALPVLTLVLAVIPYLTRLQRASMIDVLESDYVQMARLKGLPERVVVRRHALRNSLVPVIQGSALTLIYLTGGIVASSISSRIPGSGARSQRRLQVGICRLFRRSWCCLPPSTSSSTSSPTFSRVLLVPRLRTKAT